jgi:hypothetical protein
VSVGGCGGGQSAGSDESELKSLNTDLKGSRKNKFAILGVEAPGRQGAKTQEYLDFPIFRTSSRTGCIGVQNVALFLSEP